MVSSKCQKPYHDDAHGELAMTIATSALESKRIPANDGDPRKFFIDA